MGIVVASAVNVTQPFVQSKLPDKLLEWLQPFPANTFAPTLASGPVTTFCPRNWPQAT